MGSAYVRRLFAAALSLASVTGCQLKSGQEMYPVRGEVTYKGQPLTRGIVTYMPAQQGAGRTANGPLQPDGTFTMTTQTRDDGVMRGDYRIVIHSYEEDSQPKSREEIEAQGSSAPKMKSVVPQKYVMPETSGLTDNVDEKHSGFKKIELTD